MIFKKTSNPDFIHLKTRITVPVELIQASDGTIIEQTTTKQSELRKELKEAKITSEKDRIKKEIRQTERILENPFIQNGHYAVLITYGDRKTFFFDGQMWKQFGSGILRTCVIREVRFITDGGLKQVL